MKHLIKASYFLSLLLLSNCITVIPKDYSKINPKSSIVYKNDKVEGQEFWRHLYFPNNESFLSFEPYIGKSNGKKYLRLSFRYDGQNWIFFERAIFAGVNGKVEYSFKSYNKVTNVYSGGVYESIDIPFSDKEAMKLQEIFKAEFTFRLTGKYYQEKVYKGCPECLEILDFYKNL